MADVKTERDPGARIKHRMMGNGLKMQCRQQRGKFGLILRIETVVRWAPSRSERWLSSSACVASQIGSRMSVMLRVMTLLRGEK